MFKQQHKLSTDKTKLGVYMLVGWIETSNALKTVNQLDLMMQTNLFILASKQQNLKKWYSPIIRMFHESNV